MTLKAATSAWSLSRRSAFGLALAAAFPLPLHDRVGLAAAEPVLNSWMYAGNPARTGEFPGKGPDLGRDLAELWRIENHNGMFIRPCGVSDDVVYYFSVPDGITDMICPLIAIDAQSGEELWRRDPPVTEPASYFVSTPSIGDGILAIATYGGLLMGLDAKTGEERWIFDMQAGRSIAFYPAIVDGVLYVTDPASVNAIKLGDTPEWLWKTALADGVTTIVNPTVSVDGDFIVVGSVGPSADRGAEPNDRVTDIHVLNAADGGEAYRYQFRPIGETFQFAVQDGNLYSRADRTFQERSYVFSMTLDGTERWIARTSPDDRTYPAVSEGLVYLSVDDRAMAFDAATGKTVWNSPQLQALNSNIVLLDGVVYAGALSPAQVIYALSAQDGTVLKSIDVPFDGSEVIGATNGILIARSNRNLVALANLP